MNHRLTGNESHNGRSLLLWVDCDDDDQIFIDQIFIDVPLGYNLSDILV